LLPFVNRNHHLEIGAGEADDITETAALFLDSIFLDHLLTKTVPTDHPSNRTKEEIRENTGAGAFGTDLKTDWLLILELGGNSP
jgi:hypothetical protein